MARKVNGSKCFVSADIIAALAKYREAQGRVDSMTSYVQWVLKQYVDGRLKPADVHVPRAIRVRRISGEDEQRKVG